MAHAGRSLFTYPFRRAATLATLLDRPDDLLSRWDTLLRQRPVVAVAAADAHARVGPGGDPYGRSLSLHVPSYEQVFRTLSISFPRCSCTATRATMRARARRDPRRPCLLDDRCAWRALQFSRSPQRAARIARLMGERLSLDGSGHAARGGERTRWVEHQACCRMARRSHQVRRPFWTTWLRRNASRRIASRSTSQAHQVRRRFPGLCRIRSTSAPLLARTRRRSRPRSRRRVAVYTNGPATDWRIEKSVRSEGTIGVAPERRRHTTAPSLRARRDAVRVAVRGRRRRGGFRSRAIHRVTFTARATTPMRTDVSDACNWRSDRRWGRSVYLDDMARTVTIAFAEMLPLGTASPAAPALEDVRDLLFVVDTVHAKQGSSGQIWLDEIRYVR